jgi:predicted ArsR family transcriptional regulator
MSEQKVHHALSSKTRADILKLLYKKAQDVEEIAQKLKLQPVTIRHHLQSLEEAGLLETYEERSGSAGRPKTLYKVAKAPPIVNFPARRYLVFSGFLIDSLQHIVGKDKVQGIISKVGRKMGKETVEQMVQRYNISKWTPKEFEEVFIGQYLQEAGTEPEIVEKDDTKVIVRLHNCIFSELSMKMPELMCDIAHKEFFRAASEVMSGDIKVTQATCMGRGDNYCEHVFEWNSSAKKK